MNARASHASGTVPILLLAAAMAAPCPVSAQEEWPPRLRIGDSFSIRPQGLLHLDLGTAFDQNRPGGPGGGVNARRARIRVEGGFLDDCEFKLVRDFGGVPGSRNRLYQAGVAYTGLGSAAVIAGVFEPTFSLQQSSATLSIRDHPLGGALASPSRAQHPRRAADAGRPRCPRARLGDHQPLRRRRH